MLGRNESKQTECEAGHDHNVLRGVDEPSPFFFLPVCLLLFPFSQFLINYMDPKRGKIDKLGIRLCGVENGEDNIQYLLLHRLFIKSNWLKNQIISVCFNNMPSEDNEPQPYPRIQKIINVISEYCIFVRLSLSSKAQTS